MKKCVTFLTYRWSFTSFSDTAADFSYCSVQEEHRGKAEFNLSLGFHWEWSIIAQQPDSTFLIGFLNKLFHHLIYYLWCSCASSHALLIAEMLPSVAQNFLSALLILQHGVVGEKHWTSNRSTSSDGKKEKKKNSLKNILPHRSLQLSFNHTSVTFFLCGKILCEKQPRLVSDAAEFDHVATWRRQQFPLPAQFGSPPGMLQSETLTHPFQPGAQQGLRCSWAALQWDAPWKTEREKEGKDKAKTEVQQMYRVRKEKEEAGD